jgi:hypothetical protein
VPAEAVIEEQVRYLREHYQRAADARRQRDGKGT